MNSAIKVKDSGALCSSWIQISWLPPCIPGWNPSANHPNPGFYCKKTQLCWQWGSHRLTGHSDGWSRGWGTPQIHTRRSCPTVQTLSKNCCGALPSTQTPRSTVTVKMIWLHFFKNDISLPTVKNSFVISCWFCWSSLNSFASEILKGSLQKKWHNWVFRFV